MSKNNHLPPRKSMRDTKKNKKYMSPQSSLTLHESSKNTVGFDVRVDCEKRACLCSLPSDFQGSLITGSNTHTHIHVHTFVAKMIK